jgi:hypothetical protein
LTAYIITDGSISIDWGRIHLDIRNLAALDLSHATVKGWVNRVESLLASGVDPNTLFHGEESAIAAQANDAARDEHTTQPPQVYSDKRV